MTSSETTFNDEELIARLREIQGQAGLFASVAADRIETLIEQRAAARQDAEEAEAYAEGVEREQKGWQEAAVKLMNKLTTSETKLAENEVRLRKAVELLEAWGDVAVHCSIEEGVCCCGDNMENHTNPMDCGHTPLDHGTYIVIQLAEETRTTLAEIKGDTQ